MYKLRCISLEERKQIINELKLVSQYNNGISKIANLLNSASNKPSKFRTRN